MPPPARPTPARKDARTLRLCPSGVSARYAHQLFDHARPSPARRFAANRIDRCGISSVNSMILLPPEFLGASFRKSLVVVVRVRYPPTEGSGRRARGPKGSVTEGAPSATNEGTSSAPKTAPTRPGLPRQWSLSNAASVISAANVSGASGGVKCPIPSIPGDRDVGEERVQPVGEGAGNGPAGTPPGTGNRRQVGWVSYRSWPRCGCRCWEIRPRRPLDLTWCSYSHHPFGRTLLVIALHSKPSMGVWVSLLPFLSSSAGGLVCSPDRSCNVAIC